MESRKRKKRGRARPHRLLRGTSLVRDRAVASISVVLAGPLTHYAGVLLCGRSAQEGAGPSRLRAQMARAVGQSKMAATVFRPTLRDWGCYLRWSYALRQLSQTQGPPDNPSFVESVDEYQFVERLFPPTKIPEPPKHKHYPTPSGWQPPRDPPPNLPYFVRRSRMHNIPVYKDITHGNRQMTVIRKVEGNIWALQKDVEEFLSPQLGRTPITQVNEVTGTLRIKGYFDEQLKAWLLEKGF